MMSHGAYDGKHQYLQPVLSPLLQRAGIRHGFFTRRGGVSAGLYESLNVGLSSRDSRAHVLKNRRRAAAYFNLQASHLLTPYQIHSDTAAAVTAPWQGDAAHADALVTRAENLAIGIMTADCGAVLFADPKAGIIGAAHAGWKGALNGILQNTIAAMIKIGAKAENILAVSGPSISPQNYEVGEEFRQNFISKNADYDRYFMPWTEKDSAAQILREKHHRLKIKAEQIHGSGARQSYHCDLWVFIHDRLEECGVHAEDLRICTYADEQRFFSFRRATHKGETDYGRQLSAICLH